MLIDNELFAGRIVRLPRTGKDWAVLIIAIVIWFLLSLLFEKKLSNMKREHRRIVEAVCMLVIVILLELLIS
ncbi:hypothetical protein [Ruminococcus flavefaciens]|jgi:low temperature requirement protein LtrA|uniref:hypothetical protein n=2 Tax=Ruminococcus TaxID=1263 RepID=UPI000AFCC50A|nr:hypothetical protein [Ruminococcus flavefaciens]